MTPQKPAEAGGQKAGSTAGAADSGRKAWTRKTPVEIVLEQIRKQSERVAEMRKELEKEEKELQKLEAARKVLETK